MEKYEHLNYEHLNTSLQSVLEVLQGAQARPDRDSRIYYTMGVMESFLENLSQSSRFTKAQQAQLSQICLTWNEVVFGKKEADVLGNGSSSESCPTDEKEEV